MNELSQHIRAFAVASSRFGDQLDRWVGQFPSQAKEEGAQRCGLLLPRVALHQLSAALEWGPSVGLYGESQCGKSMLVSRFAGSLGAAAGADGSLLIADPTPIEHRTTNDPAKRPRWYPAGDDEAAAFGGIDFVDWFDPNRGSECTGIICRFTHNAPVGAKPGCYLLELMTLSELVTSLALGYEAEVTDKPLPGREEQVRKTLERISRRKREPDVEHIMPQLLHAWEHLVRPQVLGEKQRFRILDHEGHWGWDEFVRQCVNEGTRPAIDPAGGTSDLDQLVELLWDCCNPVTRVWKRAFEGLRRLGWAERAWLSASDVCRDNRQGQDGVPLTSVEWIMWLLDPGARKTCFVEPVGVAGGERALSASTLVALTRTLVLPLPRSGTEVVQIDVLDYPGTIRGQGDTDFETNEKPEERACYALRRGKIDRLFTNSIDLYDASTLCLAMQAQGTPSGGAIIMKALAHWLERENWVSSKHADKIPAGYVDPSLVVAITKADEAWKKAPQAFVSTSENLVREYSKDPNWMDSWSPLNPRQPEFGDVFWVHNPKFAKDTFSSASATEIDGKVLACLSREVVTRYMRDPKIRLKALTSNPPEDVRGLFDRVKEITSEERRLVRLCDAVTERLSQLLRKAPRYIGRGDSNLVQAARAAAAAHVQALEDGLRRKPHVFSEFLHALSVSPEFVGRAFARAREAAARDDEVVIGTISFDEFFDVLTSAYVSRLDRDLQREERWATDLNDEVREPLVKQFRRVPAQEWFKSAVCDAAQTLINDFDPEATNVEALSSVVSAIWNRNMVWLGDVPRAALRPAELPPKLRPASAAMRGILEHWKTRLPAVYAKLVDPSNCTTEHNMALGKVLRELRQNVEAFLAATADIGGSESWRRAHDNVVRLLDQVPREEPNAGGAL